LHNSIERRLFALEGKLGVNQRGTYAGLVALHDAGLLTVTDMTDQELWWLVAGREEDAPLDEEEFERRLVDVAATGKLPTVDDF